MWFTFCTTSTATHRITNVNFPLSKLPNFYWFFRRHHSCWTTCCWCTNLGSLYLQQFNWLLKRVIQWLMTHFRQICLFDASIASYTFIACMCYYMCLSHCIIKMNNSFNPNSSSVTILYHVGSNLAGLVYIGIGFWNHDLGVGILGSCAMLPGSFLMYHCLLIYIAFYVLH